MLGYAGLDVHKDSVQACLINEQGIVLSQKRFTTNEAGLLALLNTTKEYNCVMESSTACFLVYDYLKDQGVTVRVAHPKRLKAISSAKIKTDKVDAETLAQLNRANLIPESYVPNKEIRQQQDIIREHMQLTKQKTRIINQTKAFLLKNGIKTKRSPLTKGPALKLIQASDLPENIKIKFTNQKQQHDLLKKQLKIVDDKIKELSKNNPNALLLDTIPGVASFTALTIALQIDNIQRFPTVDHLISYAGLCPNIYQSGNIINQSRLTKDNCKIMRWTMTQAAWRAVTNSQHFKQIFEEKIKNKGKQKAIIIVAKKMLTIMYFMLRNKTPYNYKLEGAPKVWEETMGNQAL